MKTASRKAKGRTGQQEVCQQLRDKPELSLQEGDISSTSMGAPGNDIKVSPYGFKRVYFDGWEIKRRAKISICRWFDQVLRRKNQKPIVCFREDRGEWYSMIRFADLLELLAIRAIYLKENLR